MFQLHKKKQFKALFLEQMSLTFTLPENVDLENDESVQNLILQLKEAARHRLSNSEHNTTPMKNGYINETKRDDPISKGVTSISRLSDKNNSRMTKRGYWKTSLPSHKYGQELNYDTLTRKQNSLRNSRFLSNSEHSSRFNNETKEDSGLQTKRRVNMTSLNTGIRIISNSAHEYPHESKTKVDPSDRSARFLSRGWIMLSLDCSRCGGRMMSKSSPPAQSLINEGLCVNLDCKVYLISTPISRENEKKDSIESTNESTKDGNIFDDDNVSDLSEDTTYQLLSDECKTSDSFGCRLPGSELQSRDTLRNSFFSSTKHTSKLRQSDSLLRNVDRSNIEKNKAQRSRSSPFSRNNPESTQKILETKKPSSSFEWESKTLGEEYRAKYDILQERIRALGFHESKGEKAENSSSYNNHTLSSYLSKGTSTRLSSNNNRSPPNFSYTNSRSYQNEF